MRYKNGRVVTERLLLETDDHLTAISGQCGFSDTVLSTIRKRTAVRRGYELHGIVRSLFFVTFISDSPNDRSGQSSGLPYEIRPASRAAVGGYIGNCGCKVK